MYGLYLSNNKGDKTDLLAAAFVENSPKNGKVCFFFNIKTIVLFISNCFDALTTSAPTLHMELERGGIRGITHSRFLQDQRKRRIAVFHEASRCVFVMKAS